MTTGKRDPWAAYLKRWRQIEPEARKAMEAWRNTLALDGVKVGELWEYECEDYGLHFEVTRDDGTQLDVSISLVDSHDADGEYAPGKRGNLKLDIVEWGGRIVGSLIPYNYTGRVWARYGDNDEWEDRAHIILTADALYCIGEWLAGAGRSRGVTRIHQVYAELSEEDREKIDSLYDTVALHMRTDGEHPDGGDDAERLVEALSVYLVASRERWAEVVKTRVEVQNKLMESDVNRATGEGLRDYGVVGDN